MKEDMLSVPADTVGACRMKTMMKSRGEDFEPWQLRTLTIRAAGPDDARKQRISGLLPEMVSTVPLRGLPQASTDNHNHQNNSPKPLDGTIQMSPWRSVHPGREIRRASPGTPRKAFPTDVCRW